MTTAQQTDLADQTVLEVDPRAIDPDEDNPRGESPEKIQADADFVKLRDSVALFGVLVPLVVRRAESGPFPYVLVDGERRLRAALSVNAKTVPVRVVSSFSADALAQSFHIHSLRKQWEPIAYVHAVKGLVDRLREKDRARFGNEAELKREIARLTGLGPVSLERYLRTALRYDRRQLSEVDGGTVDISYVWEIEESFIERIRARFPTFFGTFGEKVVRARVFEKAKRGVLGAAQGLRSLGPLFEEGQEDRKRAFAEKLLEKFVRDDDASPTGVLEEFRARYPQGGEGILEFAEAVQASAKQLAAEIKALDLQKLKTLYPEAARNLGKALRALAQKIGKAFGQD